MTNKPKYSLSIDLNALNHLGINLYSNTPAVLSEVVANSWDADAKKVTIDIEHNAIMIGDDGFGMTAAEINEKYLKVGYRKREKESVITPKGRHVMGRKGIGKLSLFSIADTIEVHSVKTNKGSKIIEKNGLIMNSQKIQKAIEDGNASYHPEVVPASRITIRKGTKIILRDLRKNVDTTENYLRKRLARRFSVIGADQEFSVIVNKKAITVQDRDYFKKIEFLWHIGDGSEKYVSYSKNAKKTTKLDGMIDGAKGYNITGWVGTFDEQQSIEEGNNSIVILAWGKLIHEDILKDIKEGGVFTKYLIGEIRADFLDSDQNEDIATSDRQNLKENDPRFTKLRDYIQKEILRDIQNKWRDWRNEGAEEKALQNAAIKQWFERLGKDNKKSARELFGKIESLPIADPTAKRELYKHGILAFETLALKNNLTMLETVDTEKDFKLVQSVFESMDDLELVHYGQIARNRFGVLKKFQDIAPNAKEKVIQQHIFDHLWLLDPSWERASTDQHIEEKVITAFGKISAKLKKEEREGRVDIRYQTAAGKHIIIELKRYSRLVSATELIEQIGKYRDALEKILSVTYPKRTPDIEVICILGRKPPGKDKENREMLRAINAKYITYDTLIQQTRDSYRDFIDKNKELERIQKMIEGL
jgi:hypothetical protein